jgi:hypothetical protein
MTNVTNDFLFEYFYTPCPDAEERLTQAWDIILVLILEDFEQEKQGDDFSESATC